MSSRDVEIIPCKFGNQKDIKIGGRLIWLPSSCPSLLTEQLDDSKIDLKINLPYEERGPGHFGSGDGFLIGTYQELEDREKDYLVKQHVYYIMGSLIIEYYKEWKWSD